MTMDRQTLHDLIEARWAIPVLALLHRDDGARFAVMAHRLAVAPQSLSRTLAHLIERGWVVRNAGHGHPLRPEYLLTAVGEPVGAACARIVAAREQLGLSPRDVPRWSLPVAIGLGDEWLRFGALQHRIGRATPRALSMTLKTMIVHDLVGRRLEASFPPVALYGLTPRGRDLARAAA